MARSRDLARYKNSRSLLCFFQFFTSQYLQQSFPSLILSLLDHDDCCQGLPDPLLPPYRFCHVRSHHRCRPRSFQDMFFILSIQREIQFLCGCALLVVLSYDPSDNFFFWHHTLRNFCSCHIMVTWLKLCRRVRHINARIYMIQCVGSWCLHKSHVCLDPHSTA